MSITPKQLKRFHTLCSVLKLDKEAKCTMIYDFTEGRCTSSKELTHEEIELLTSRLASMQPQRMGADDRSYMINKVYAIAYDLGVIDQKMPAAQKKARLDGLCVSKGGFKKQLNDHSYFEMVKLVTNLSGMKSAIVQDNLVKEARAIVNGA